MRLMGARDRLGLCGNAGDRVRLYVVVANWPLPRSLLQLPVMARSLCSRAGAHFHPASVWLVRSFKLCGVRGE
jgi:hypothetical protein